MIFRKHTSTLPSPIPSAPMSRSSLQRKCACGGTPGPTGECEECRKKRESRILQRHTRHPSSLIDYSSDVPPIVQEVLQSPGQPLDTTTHAFMSQRFSHDFGHVRIHADARAAESAREVNAQAYTVGSHVAFAPSEYAPGTRKGQRLLAHELAHVVQQRTAAASAPPDKLSIGKIGDAAEQQADQAAADIDRHTTPRAATSPTQLSLQRMIFVNPPAAVGDILGQVNTLCKGFFGSAGSQITAACSAAARIKDKSCECLCDAAHDLKRTYSINVKSATVTTKSETLFDGSTASLPETSVFPETLVGTNPTITMPTSAGSKAEFGCFDSSGKPLWAPNWRILAHELCGHGRLRETHGGEDVGNRPSHDSTIDMENKIAKEHGEAARGHFGDPRQGESFFNAVGDRSKVKFFLSNGLHFEAP